MGTTRLKFLPGFFLNLHEELVLGIPWLVGKNPTIKWAIGRVTIERNGIVHTLPYYRQYLNKPEDQEKERSTTKEINCISPRLYKYRFDEEQARTESFWDYFGSWMKGRGKKYVVALLT